MFELIPSDAAVDLLARVVDFRERDGRPQPAEEAAALLSLFPGVRVRDGYLLDFSQETTAAGVIQPIRPYVRPAGDESWVPLFDEEIERDDLVEQLYQYLEYDRTPQGLFEYAFFVIELWSLRLSRHAADWLESTPIFDAAAFDAVVAQADKATEVKRPEYFGPQARFDDDGGARLRFLVHTPMGWERIYYLESLVFSDGFVEQEAGEIVADLGSGLVF
ncbi:MAG: hypothetical protein O2782_07125 [bacterium]|nr:hypothetical protein [bacterium]